MLDRRLRTGRKLIGKDESPTPAAELPWLPQDEYFNSDKNFGKLRRSGSGL